MSSSQSASPNKIAIPLMIAGFGVAGVAFSQNFTLGLGALLIAALYGLTIAMGSALFAAINTVAGAKWWRSLAHVCLTNAKTMVVPALLMIVVLAVGVNYLYPWASHGVVERGHHLLHHKTGWLNQPFFLARAGFVLLVWFFLVASLAKRVQAKDFVRMPRTGIVFLILFSLTLALAFWDWGMSLEPEWFSTMYGVYGFAGTLHVGIAGTLLFSLRDKNVGPKPLYDLGSLLFAFSCFWGYIWFCQAMLIWYATIPEETFYYAHRLTGGWTAVFWINPLINLVIPMVCLMSRHAKRNRMMLKSIALVVLLGHFVDMLLLVGPALTTASTILPWAALGASVAVLAAMLLWRHRVAQAA